MDASISSYIEIDKQLYCSNFCSCLVSFRRNTVDKTSLIDGNFFIALSTKPDVKACKIFLVAGLTTRVW